MNSPDRRRWLWALGALALSMLVIGLDSAVLTVAVPTLAQDLGASTSQRQWINTSYTLVLAAALLFPAGALGDRYGRRKLMLGALLVFGAASVACVYAGSADPLIIARSVLGLAAAVLIPMSMAVLPCSFLTSGSAAGR